MKRLITIAIIVLAIPVGAMLVLSRWNYLQADDHMCGLLNRNFGFWGMQQWIYMHNTGRFTSSFLAAIAGQGDLLFHHPWLFPVILITGELVMLYLLARSTLRLSGRMALLFSLCLFLTRIIMLPEPSTALYWFSGAATYEFSFLILLALLYCMHAYVNNRKWWWLVCASLLVVAAGGTNELSAPVILLSLSAVLYILLKRRRMPLLPSIWLSLLAAVSLLLLFMAPGIYERRAALPEPDLTTAIISSAGWSVYTFWLLAKQPVFWLLSLNAFFFSNTYPTSVKPGWPLLCTLLGIQYFSLFIVLYATHGSIPPRMLNAFVWLQAIPLVLLFWQLGTSLKPLLQEAVVSNMREVCAAALVMATLLSPLSGYIFQSLVSAPFEHHVQAGWISQCERSASSGKATAELEHRDQLINRLIVNSDMKAVLREIAQREPPLFAYDFDERNEVTIDHLMMRFNLEKVVWQGMLRYNPHWEFNRK